MSLHGKTALVTGGARGIGFATVQRLLREGARCVIWDRDQAAIDEATANLADVGEVTSDTVELAKPESVEAAAGQALGRHGQIDILVNNAGMSPKTSYKERLGCLNGDLEAWREVFETNFYAPLRLSRGFASALHKGKGAIVNITSIAGHMIHPFAGSAYSISKSALSALTRELANEMAALDVRVNAVAPGEIETDMVQPEYEALIPRIPLNRMGAPGDVAGTVYYLCSDDSAYVTGTEVWITGGQHLF